MPEQTDKRLVLNSFIWRYMDRTAVQAVQFVVSILLARILAPEEFGALCLVTVFLNVALVFVQHGIGSAIIQKQDVTEGEFTSSFYFSIIMGGALALILVILSPVICRLLGYPDLISLLRVLALTLPLAGASNVLEAKLTRNLDFKKIFVSNISGAAASATASIWAAVNGFGIWALVVQQITFQLVAALFLLRLASWKPAAPAPLRDIFPLISYGWKILMSSFIDTVYANFRTLLIGKYFSSETVGYYDKGRQFPGFVIANINATIQAVLFPALSRKQSDRDSLKSMVRQSISVGTYVIFPCMTGLMIIAPPLVRLLLTDKWLPAVPFLRCFCLVYSFWPVSTTNLQAIKAVGRSDIFLRLEIIKKVIGISIMLVTLPFGIQAMMAGSCVNAAIALFLNALPNKKLIQYRFVELFWDMLPAACLSGLMGIVTSLIGLCLHHDLLLVVCQIIAGAGAYIFFSVIFHAKSFLYLADLIKKAFNHRPLKSGRNTDVF